ncbi:MAG: hypothetical protein AAFY38_07420 [Pseudomonadota bacterium]
MLDDTQTIGLTARELELIEAALQTQEKILSVQSRAGGGQAKARLADLQGVQRRIRGMVPKEPRVPLWTRILRALPCPRCAEA